MSDMDQYKVTVIGIDMTFKEPIDPHGAALIQDFLRSLARIQVAISVACEKNSSPQKCSSRIAKWMRDIKPLEPISTAEFYRQLAARQRDWLHAQDLPRLQMYFLDDHVSGQSSSQPETRQIDRMNWLVPSIN